MDPQLRTWTASELLGGGAVAAGEPTVFPDALPDSHPAVAQFREFGYVVITDAIHPEALARATNTFRAKQAYARQLREQQRQHAPPSAQRPGQAPAVSELYFDLPRDDTLLTDGSSNGSHGSFLVTKEAVDFDAFMGVLANAQALPLLLALAGPAMHLLEVGGRTVDAPPMEQALQHGGYTEWHRDAGGRTANRVADDEASTGGSQLAPERLSIGQIGCDYNRVKCFAMLTDVTPAGGPLGLVPGSHLWWGTPPDEYRTGANMGGMPGHVKVVVPAGGMALFDQRCWHTGLPNTNGQSRESFIFTYGGPLRVASTGGGSAGRVARWPVGSYGKAGNNNFLSSGKELEALGRLNTPVRQQLFGAALTHPAAPRERLHVTREPLEEHPQHYLEEIQFTEEEQ
jgi:hypothetical protein